MTDRLRQLLVGDAVEVASFGRAVCDLAVLRLHPHLRHDLQLGVRFRRLLGVKRRPVTGRVHVTCQGLQG